MWMGVRLKNFSTYSPSKRGPSLEFINIQPQKAGRLLDFINIQPPNRGPTLEFINPHPKNGGSPLEFINHQPKNGGPPLGTISMDLAVLQQYAQAIIFIKTHMSNISTILNGNFTGHNTPLYKNLSNCLLK